MKKGLFGIIISVLLILMTLTLFDGAPQVNTAVEPTPGGGSNAIVAGPPPFRAFWQMHGGERILGRYVAGPCLYGDAVLGIYAAAVARISLTYPEEGARFYPINQDRREPPAPQVNDPALLYRAGHNVPRLFVTFIKSLGGWAIVGNPVNERYEDGANFCQDFENLTLCFNQHTREVFINPTRGEAFYASHKAACQPLQRAPSAASNWHIQMTADWAGDSVIQLKATMFFAGASQGVPADSRAIVEVFSSRNGEVLWLNVRTLAETNGVIDAQIPVGYPDVSQGMARYVVRVCVWQQSDGLQACEETSVQRWYP